MDSNYCLLRNVEDELRNSALAPHVDAYLAYLKRGRYAQNTVSQYLRCITHFARWMQQTNLSLNKFDEAAVARFLNKHLPHCHCLTPAVRVHDDLRAACGHLLRVLREHGAIAMPAVASGPIEDEIRDFDAYLHQVRGQGTEIRRIYARLARRFLQRRFGKRAVVMSALQPADIRQFLAEELDKRSTYSNAATLASSLRAYFRYRGTQGDRIHHLTGVIASPAHWNLASLPRSLSNDEIDRLLNAFPDTLPSSRRGYAMVRCALDMGLRISEIAKLALADIDWHNGTVTLRRNKSRREDILPLPAVTGQAIADYLRLERPPTTNPAVFARHLAPHDAPITTDTVHRLIRDAYQRIGITHTRTHALRHSTARRLLEQGSSLKEVADVLRHRSLNTSLIYAKLDNHKLAAVALPWPGSAT
jgi:integrase/recombinase XerC